MQPSPRAPTARELEPMHRTRLQVQRLAETLDLAGKPEADIHVPRAVLHLLDDFERDARLIGFSGERGRGWRFGTHPLRAA